jgi:Copper amine oxidase, enzyme domain
MPEKETEMPGSVQHANWSVCWFVPSMNGEGLKIAGATFNGRSVIASGGAPFVIVPYHGESPTFKDGLNPQCGGLPYLALIPTAPNVHQNSLPPNNTATNDNEFHAQNNPRGAVVVEKHGKGWIEPEHLVVWAKFQCGNYQYVHRWVFHADGSVHVEVGLGGKLGSWGPQLGHIHHFYFRLDLDIDGAGNNQAQRLHHGGWGLNQDAWLSILTETTNTANPAGYTKWKVVNKAAKPNGQFRSYELVPGSDGGPDGKYSTNDVWVCLYKSGTESGSDVGSNCKDTALTTAYVNPPENVDGKDVVLWYCLRHHHFTRYLGEEKKVLPYHFVRFHLEPRDFLDDTPTGLYSTNPSSP